jgi:restriction system protein
VADPRTVESVDVISEFDRCPNLIDLTPKIASISFRTSFNAWALKPQTQNSSDRGVDVIAFDHDRYARQNKSFKRRNTPANPT